jgi:mannose-6-phosphate isomerase
MQTRKLVERLRGEHQASKASGPAWLKKSQRAVLQLAESHPQQMGAMLPLLLNYLLVAPGEAFYVAPCEPHAYVAGECVEVCACSDNFVRIGLSQNIDAEAAITLLSYETGGPDVEFGSLKHQGPGTHTLRYAPDVADFEARVTTVEPGGCFELESFPVPSILLVVAGSGETGVLAHGARSPPRKHRYTLVPGTALYVTEGTLHLAVSVPSSNSGPLRLVRCCENLDGVLQAVAET